MAVATAGPALAAPQPRRMLSSHSSGNEEMSTLPDPRSRAMSPANADGAATPIQHPDLDSEVAALSAKLINAINHQTTLDDTLSETRHELDTSRDQIRQLEQTVAQQKEMLAGDVWVRRKSVESEKNQLLGRLTEEKRLRLETEKEKKKIEQELENLTTALFEEANKMVISAKEEAQKEQEAMQRKNDQLKAQLKDTEGLLKFQQEQLAELKQVMEQMSVAQEEQSCHTGTAPSSPGLSRFDAKDEESRASETASQSGGLEAFSPTYPTNLTHLVQPVLRTDIGAFEDFLTLAKLSKNHTGSRASSGSFTGLNPLGVLNSGSGPSNASTTSLSTSGGTPASNLSPQTPNTPGSTLSTGSTPSAIPLPPLKETKFYKRVLMEDVEPTLRLDIAPGLSWLARRSVLTAMTDGSLVVEPVPTSGTFVSITKPQFYPCSLCGESRKDTTYLRNHRFRTSESGTAQRYPLCKYCLSRVRATCDFLGFLRIVKDGHWRADDEDAEKAAWEESVRLREQMFWSRIGGGVIPSGHLQGDRSPRLSQEAPHKEQEIVDEKKHDEAIKAVLPPELKSEQEDTVDPDSAPGSAAESKAETETIRPATSEPDEHSTESPAANSEFEKDGVKQLSITIPGSFDG